MATQVLGQVDLTGTIVTADALHTVKATAEFICERGGEFVLPVKENRQALFDALDALPWQQAPVSHAQTDRGHCRVTTRTIQVMPAPENLPLPARPPGPADRTLRQRPGRQAGLRRRGARRGQSRPGPRQSRRPGPLRARALGGRVLALAARHPVSGGQIPGQNPVWAADHGSPAQPGHRSPAPGRAHRHHRSHPMGQPVNGPTIHHPPSYGPAGQWTDHSPSSVLWTSRSMDRPFTVLRLMDQPVNGPTIHHPPPFMKIWKRP